MSAIDCSVRLIAAACLLALPLAAATVDFQRQVRPILSDACFQCHGPDSGTRMAGLRLDTKDGALSERKNGRVIVPGDPQASLLYQRITHEKESMRMPPAVSHKTLSAAQKELLRAWIEQGATWKEHWSFAAPTRPALPSVSLQSWPRNPIDRFILARLDATGLQPAPEANQRALIRRVSLDMTGLVPTPAEVEAFVHDVSTDAYEKLVDRLLASPRYGEHRARYWLDAARYADTHGIHIDNYREMWLYRDWVIGAFNRNLPFDQFTVEQLAGDLLPNRTMEDQIASGFQRCNATTNEGGSIPEEVDAMYAKDRVETMSTVWLGLTTGCATCHDHKFDPIAQKEFYQFAAFFRNTTQRPMDGNVPDTPPMLVVPAERDLDRWNQLRAEAQRLARLSVERHDAAGADLDHWLASRPMIEDPLDRAMEAASIGASGNRIVARLDTASTSLPATTSVESGPGPDGQTRAIHFGENGVLPLSSFNAIDADKPFSIAAWIYLPAGEGNFVVASQLEKKKETKQDDDDEGKMQGWAIEINGRIPSLRLSSDNIIRAAAGVVERLKAGAWTHLTFTYDGSRDRRGFRIYMNGKAATVEGTGSAPALKGSIHTGAPLLLGGDGKRYFTEGAIADLRVYRRVLREQESHILASWTAIRAGQHEALLEYYLNRADGPYLDLVRQAEQVDAERQAIRLRSPTTLVMQEKPDTMPTAQVLFRGQYDQPRDMVTPGVPAVLPPMPASLPRNRLGLAKWLVDPANPLMARVTVNRFWQEVFGRGLVKTAEDFGSQGEPPTHPELLDWLAVDFRESGWDVKRLLRLIVTSDSYRQSAAATEDKLRVDPDNRLLSRGPRFRMDAEMVRDLALSSSGLLDATIGGPSVKPYQPNGVWETVAMKSSNTRMYAQDHGDKLYRRSMYTFWKRAAPPASMDIFNAPTRENCTVRRERTNTPLQALVTLNDPQFVEASRQLAERAILAVGSDVDRRLDFISLSIVSRPFETREREIVKREVRDLLAYYDAHPADAAKLLTVGESKRDLTIPAAEFAAWTMAASDVLNLDEALNK